MLPMRKSSIRIKVLLYFSALVTASILVTGFVFELIAERALISQAEADAEGVGRVLAGSIALSKAVPGKVETVINEAMLIIAKMVAQYIALAERSRVPAAATRAVLQRIIDETALDEIWVTDSSGRVVGSAPPDIRFTFSPDSSLQPQASQFWPLLTGSSPFVIQRARARDLDGKIFKYVGVAGVDKPRIVLVSLDESSVDQVRSMVGLSTAIHAFVHDGLTRRITVIDQALNVIADQASLANEPAFDAARGNRLADVVRSGTPYSEITPYGIEIYRPLRMPTGEAVGGFFVRIRRDLIDSNRLELGHYALVAAFVLMLVGGGIAFLFSGWIVAPIARLTDAASAVQKGDFRVLDDLPKVREPHDEIGRLTLVFREMTLEVRNRELILDKRVNERTAELARQNHLLEVAQSAIDDELANARRLQEAILPGRFPAVLGVDGFAAIRPATWMGGDFYDFIALPGGRIALIIADVSGKGVTAAFFMAVARTSLNGLVRRKYDDPGACLSHANSEICSQNPFDMFVTAFLGVFDPATGALSYANAGHNRPLIHRKDGATEWVESDRELPLGAFEGVSYKTREVALGQGDVLLMYTDGVTEAFNAQEQMYGEARLTQFLGTTGQADPQKLVELLVAEVDRFANGFAQSDDVTVAAIRFDGERQMTV